MIHNNDEDNKDGNDDDDSDNVNMASNLKQPKALTKCMKWNRLSTRQVQQHNDFNAQNNPD